MYVCISFFLWDIIQLKHSAQIFDDIISRCAEVGNVLSVPCGKEIVANRFKVKKRDKTSE